MSVVFVAVQDFEPTAKGQKLFFMQSRSKKKIKKSISCRGIGVCAIGLEMEVGITGMTRVLAIEFVWKVVSATYRRTDACIKGKGRGVLKRQ